MRLAWFGGLIGTFLLGCGGGPVDSPADGFTDREIATPASTGPFPPPSGACSITHPLTGNVTALEWNKDTLTLLMGDMFWKLDEQAHVTEHGAVNNDRRHLMTYDEFGKLATFVYEWHGEESLTNSWDQHNTYGGPGRLISSTVVHRDNTVRKTTTFVYENDRLVREDVVTEYDGTQTLSGYSYVYDQSGRLEVTLRGPLDAPYTETRAFYARTGQLLRLDTDGGGFGPTIDGIADIRQEWTYDDEGHIAGFTQDGTEILDAPIVDGVVDERFEFEAACADIAVLPREIYRLPGWVTQAQTQTRFPIGP